MRAAANGRVGIPGPRVAYFSQEAEQGPARRRVETRSQWLGSGGPGQRAARISHAAKSEIQLIAEEVPLA